VKAPFLTLIAALLFGCQNREPAITDADFEAYKASHPGMKKTCLDAVRYGGFGASNLDEAECYELMPAQRWSGVWEQGWEWSHFCADPVKKCEWMSHPQSWLTFAETADPGQLPEGNYRIEFLGRRTKVPGYFGHLSVYEHLMVVDQVISVQRIK